MEAPRSDRETTTKAEPTRADDQPRVTHEPHSTDEPLVDWVATARRVWRSTTVLLGLALLGWVVRAALVDAWSWSHLGNWLGLALAAIFAMELLVVGGSALRGMLRAGERGERLSSHDVGLLPPVRWHRGDGADTEDPDRDDAGA